MSQYLVIKKGDACLASYCRSSTVYEQLSGYAQWEQETPIKMESLKCASDDTQQQIKMQFNVIDAIKNMINRGQFESADACVEATVRLDDELGTLAELYMALGIIEFLMEAVDEAYYAEKYKEEEGSTATATPLTWYIG